MGSGYEVLSEEDVKLFRDFASDAFDFLAEKHGKPVYRRPPLWWSSNWKRDKRNREQLSSVAPSASWTATRHDLMLPDWLAFMKFESYLKVRDKILADKNMSRRTRIAYGLPLEDVILADSDKFSNVDWLLQTGLLKPLVDLRKKFIIDDEDFFVVCGKVDSALADTTVNFCVFTPILNLLCKSEVKFSEEVSLRLLTDDELGSGIGFDSLPVRHAPSGRTMLWAQHQSAIVTHFRFALDVSSGDREFERQIRAAVQRRKGMMADTIVSAINLLSSSGFCRRGESWSTLRSSASFVAFTEGVEYPPFGRAWASNACDLRGIDHGRLVGLVKNLERPEIVKALDLASSRLVNALGRISDEEAIVDLVIAAESLFGPKGPGETKHKVALNAALFLDGIEGRRSEVKEFFLQAYDARSGLVRGRVRKPKKSVPTPKEMRKDLTLYMREGILKAADELADDLNALDWEKRLDAILDDIQ